MRRIYPVAKLRLSMAVVKYRKDCSRSQPRLEVLHAPAETDLRGKEIMMWKVKDVRSMSI